jgi:16S rRNA (uracil1498-N3)-methyltransferase
MRCFVDPDAWGAEPIVLQPDESHYLLDVRRARPGEAVELCDGRGRIASATIQEVARGRVVVLPGPPRTHPRLCPAVTLVQALPKAQKMDWIVQKGTELGVACIVPVSTQQAVVHLNPERAGKKVDRWTTVARNATRQCGAAWVPEVEPVRRISEWLDEARRPEWTFFGDLGPGAGPLDQVLEPLRAAPPPALAFIIGPEGDFSPEEREALLAAGIQPVHFGPGTLRTETAAIYILSICRYLFPAPKYDENRYDRT